MFEKFKREHKVIIDNLRKIKKLNIHTKKGQLELLAAKNDILAHMKNENEKFYSVLKKRAGSNGRLKETLNAFDKDMIVISKYTLDFFESILTEVDIDLDLALERFIEVHSTRMLREEAILYAKCGNAT